MGSRGEIYLIYDASIERIKAELTWYFNYADADCGLRSNWNAMVQASMLPGSHWHDPYDSFTLKAVDKRREIEKVFFQLPSRYQQYLYVYLGPETPPGEIALIFKDQTAGAICAFTAGIQELTKLCSRIHQGTASQKDKTTISQLRMEAFTIKKQAFSCYKRMQHDDQED